MSNKGIGNQSITTDLIFLYCVEQSCPATIGIAGKYQTKFLAACMLDGRPARAPIPTAAGGGPPADLHAQHDRLPGLGCASDAPVAFRLDASGAGPQSGGPSRRCAITPERPRRLGYTAGRACLRRCATPDGRTVDDSADRPDGQVAKSESSSPGRTREVRVRPRVQYFAQQCVYFQVSMAEAERPPPGRLSDSAALPASRAHSRAY